MSEAKRAAAYGALLTLAFAICLVLLDRTAFLVINRVEQVVEKRANIPASGIPGPSVTAGVWVLGREPTAACARASQRACATRLTCRLPLRGLCGAAAAPILGSGLNVNGRAGLCQAAAWDPANLGSLAPTRRLLFPQRDAGGVAGGTRVRSGTADFGLRGFLELVQRTRPVRRGFRRVRVPRPFYFPSEDGRSLRADLPCGGREEDAPGRRAVPVAPMAVCVCDEGLASDCSVPCPGVETEWIGQACAGRVCALAPAGDVAVCDCGNLPTRACQYQCPTGRLSSSSEGVFGPRGVCAAHGRLRHAVPRALRRTGLRLRPRPRARATGPAPPRVLPVRGQLPGGAVQPLPA